MTQAEAQWWRQITLGTTPADFPPVASSADAPTIESAHHVALAWVFDHSRSSILLVEHRSLQWSCPGGHVEPGERLDAAARRELAEETGIAASPAIADPLTLARSVGCPRSPFTHTVHWAAGFVFLVDPATPITTEPGQRARWFDMLELPPARAADIDIVAEQVRATS